METSTLTAAPEPIASTAPATARSRVVLGAVALAALWVVLWWHLSSEWSINEQYSYGWFVPFFALFLLWLRWEDRPRAFGANIQRPTSNVERSTVAAIENRRRLGRTGAILAALLLSFLLPIRLFEVGNPDWRPLGWLHAGIVVGITALALWQIGGAPWLKHFAFPIGFTVVAVPWISAVELPVINGLMRAVAAVAAETLNLLGVPAQLEGSLIRVNTGLVGVNEACSGVRSLQTSLMIGLLFGELKRLSVSRRFILLAGALGIAIGANFGRAFVLVWLSATRSPALANQWHDGLGYSIVGLVFVGSLVLASRLARTSQIATRRADADSAHPQQAAGISHSAVRIPQSKRLLGAAVIWILAVEFAVAAWYRAHEQGLVPQARWTVDWPESAPGFRKIDIDEGVARTLRFDEGRQAVWTIPPPPGASFSQKASTSHGFFFRWDAGGSSVVRARAHRPDICLPSVGWTMVADGGVKDYDAAGVTIPFRRVTFRQERGNAFAHTFFCLQEDVRRPAEERPDLQLAVGTQPDWSLAGRARVVRNGVRNLGQQVLQIVIVTPGPLDEGRAERELRELLPGMIVPAQ